MARQKKAESDDVLCYVCKENVSTKAKNSWICDGCSKVVVAKLTEVKKHYGFS